MKTSKNKYFIYARKSSEGEERQARSIEDQLALIWKKVHQDKLNVVEEFTESQTARHPGRPVFNEMIRRIEEGEVNGIIAYHPDRLARNSVDGGYIMHLLDTGQLQSLVFENHWFENTSQGMYMLYMAFAQSKYYTDNLSENVRRGINSRLKRGIYPGCAKRGYINHPKTHEIIPNPATFDLVAEMFEMYSTGEYGLEIIGMMMNEKGLHNNKGGVLSASQVQKMLQDPFYYGHFKYNGELFEGIHKPCIPKELFDKTQAVMKNKGKGKTRKVHSHKFLGLMTCDECGYSITAEKQRGHVYYRCSKKTNRLTGTCKQPYLREEALVEQITAIMDQIAMPLDWIEGFMGKLKIKESKVESRENGQYLDIEAKAEEVQAKISRLADLYIEREITRAEYTARKEVLLGEKVALLERRKRLLRYTPRIQLEQMKKPLEVLQDWHSGGAGGDYEKLREFLSEVGSNFSLNSRKLLHDWLSPYEILASRGRFSSWLGS